MRVLVVEDDVRTAELLRRGLTEEGYAVDVAADGPDAVWQAAEVYGFGGALPEQENKFALLFTPTLGI
ncbi:hypothetical protein [Streptomyces sp. NBC_00842]|uniref:hypothetical protein n=1 Tax=unclassified Streptomyces TaxID=2593676 RepID=UPI00386F9C58